MVWVAVMVTVMVMVAVVVWVMVMVTVVVAVVVPMNRYDRWNVRIWSWTPPQRQYSCISSRGCVLAMQARESREKLLVVRLWNRILDWKWGLRVWSL